MKTNNFLVVKTDLRRLFAERGLSLSQAGEIANINKTTMMKVSAGKYVTPATAKKICDAFELDMWEHFEFAEE